MRLIDYDKAWAELVYAHEPYAADLIQMMPTIDPETIPVVRQLREELARVTAERDDYKELFFSYRNVCGGHDPQRISELVEADKDGRCVVLPCKNGDAVWYITPQGELCEARVIGIWLNIYTNPQLWVEITYFSNLTGQCDFKSRIDLIFGKTVFLTKEAAEAAIGKGDE